MNVYNITGTVLFKNSQSHRINYSTEAADGKVAIKKVEDFLKKGNNLISFELISCNSIGEYLPKL